MGFHYTDFRFQRWFMCFNATWKTFNATWKTICKQDINFGKCSYILIKKKLNLCQERKVFCVINSKIHEYTFQIGNAWKLMICSLNSKFDSSPIICLISVTGIFQILKPKRNAIETNRPCTVWCDTLTVTHIRSTIDIEIGSRLDVGERGSQSIFIITKFYPS